MEHEIDREIRDWEKTMEHEIDREIRDWEKKHQIDREIRDWEKTMEHEIDRERLNQLVPNRVERLNRLVPNRVELTFLCLESCSGCQDVKKLVASCLSLFPAQSSSKNLTELARLRTRTKVDFYLADGFNRF